MKYTMKERIEKVKTHLMGHRALYLTGAGCLAIGVVTGLAVRRQNNLTMQTASGEGNNNVIAKHVTIVRAELERRGHPGNIIRCKETGEVFASQQRAADVLGIDAGNLSQHLSGRFPSVKGYTFENLGEAV